MTITTRLQMNALISVGILLLVSLASVFAIILLERTQQKSFAADVIVKKGFELNSLTNRYIRTDEDRPREQWFSSFETLSRHLSKAPFTTRREQIVAGRMQQNLKIMRILFEELIASPGRSPRQNLITNMILSRSADIYLEASRLSAISKKQAESIDRAILILFPVATLGALALALWSATRIARSIIEPLGRLRAGAEIAGKGNLEHRIGMTNRDEIGQVSRAFDRMADDLQNTTVSKDELQKEIEERRRTEAALRRSEQSFIQLADAMPQIVWASRPDGVLDYFNRRWYELSGAQEGGIGDQSWLPILHPEDRQRCLDVWYESVRTGKPYQIEYRFRFPNGEYRWHLGRALPIRDENGNILRWYGTSTDIHDAKLAVEDRERLLTELKRSNTELEQFAYAASHDLQEPLRTIMNFMQLLEKRYKGRLDEKADKYIQYAVDGAERMQKLIEGLLSYSRITRKGAEFTELDLNKLVSHALSNLSMIVKETRAEVTKEELPVIWGDETQLVQLFQNLIANAVKYRKPDIAPRVHIAGRKSGGSHLFSVRDNGLGIEPQYYERIFQIFQRLHTGEEYSGAGIGLTLCKRIVERHQGKIWVESTPGQGSTFYFTVPVRQVAKQAICGIRGPHFNIR